MGLSVYKLILVTHIIGITVMAGATFIDCAIFNQFRRMYWKEKDRAYALGNIANTLQTFMGIGMLVIIVSGVGMMVYLHGVWDQQIWFRIKMVTLVLIIINGLGFRRMLGTQLQKIIDGKSIRGEQDLLSIMSRMFMVQYVQIAFFIIIFCLSVFKFN